ncbi:hypothetical protein ANCCAN_28470 [Ancylostoma caninum]|uniref:Tim10/DDP family zinc finger n=1 Tax=Ancylostoma caninum TaxID=29170 RepID=A0A368F4G4_ANCCA|nr:hypothetical protein ANCCAN_28470 [Ancylostoma caninum]
MSSSTMEATQQKVKNAVDSMIDEMDRTHLRDMQKQMFLCSANCCEHKTSSREAVEQCVEKCNAGMKNAQRTLERELGGLQVRLLTFSFFVLTYAFQATKCRPSNASLHL